MITLALDLGADKDTVFWLCYSCGQDELFTSSQQPQLFPEDLNFRLMQRWTVMQKPPFSLHILYVCTTPSRHSVCCSIGNELRISMWTPTPVPGVNPDGTGSVLWGARGSRAEPTTALLPCSPAFPAQTCYLCWGFSQRYWGPPVFLLSWPYWN